MNHTKSKSSESGQAIAEYMILLFIIVIVAIPVITKLGKTVRSKIELAKDNIDREISIDRQGR